MEETDVIARELQAAGVPFRVPNAANDHAIDNADTARRIAHVQRVIEGESFEIRRTLRVYSHLLELQRRIISKDRDDLLTRIRPPQALRKRDRDLRRRLVSQ